jgi:hypothetical protein
VRETSLNASQLVLPLFVREGKISGGVSVDARRRSDIA